VRSCRRAQDAVTGVLRALPAAAEVSGGAAAAAGPRGGPRGGPREHPVLHKLDALGEAVLHAAERAADALRIASEDGTRGTP
jgi:hypothetical protein